MGGILMEEVFVLTVSGSVQLWKVSRMGWDTSSWGKSEWAAWHVSTLDGMEESLLSSSSSLP
jgi:hypothetical protein